MKKDTRKSIFIITTLGKLTDSKHWPMSEGVGQFERDRSWGWFPTLDKAVEYLKKYPDFFHEAGWYDYVVIEETKECISHRHEEHWFKLSKKNKWVPCEKPKGVSKICGWGLG